MKLFVHLHMKRMKIFAPCVIIIAKFQILSPSMKSYLQTIQMKPLQ